jgi:uncharacterized protein YdaU (DUF1376 family)
MTLHTEPTQTPQELPPPPFGIEVDLRRFPSLPLDVQLFRDSEFVVLTSAEEFRAHFMLMFAAWHRIPAGSLPADDKLLAALAKVDQKTWKKIKNGALSGFIQHADLRLYHPLLTDTVKKSYAVMRGNHKKTEGATAARIAQRLQRHDQRDDDRDVDQRNRTEQKGEEINREEPPQLVGGGGLQNSIEIGLGDMLTGFPGFDDSALRASLTLASRGASQQQLDRALMAIKGGACQANDLPAYSVSIAKKAALGLVTAKAEPPTVPQPPLWFGKNGWSIQTESYGRLDVEFDRLRSKKGILHPDAVAIIEDALASGVLILQPPVLAISTPNPQI